MINIQVKSTYIKLTGQLLADELVGYTRASWVWNVGKSDESQAAGPFSSGDQECLGHKMSGRDSVSGHLLFGGDLVSGHQLSGGDSVLGLQLSRGQALFGEILDFLCSLVYLYFQLFRDYRHFSYLVEYLKHFWNSV